MVAPGMATGRVTVTVVRVTGMVIAPYMVAAIAELPEATMVVMRVAAFMVMLPAATMAVAAFTVVEAVAFTAVADSMAVVATGN
jgi:hypothetical protein